MLQRAAQWRLLAIAGGLSLLILYLYGLDRMGLYSADIGMSVSASSL